MARTSAEARTLEQLLGSGRDSLLEALGPEGLAELTDRAHALVGQLQPGAPRLRRTANRLNFSFAVPCAALYLALREGDVSQEQAVELTEAAMERRLRAMLEGLPLLRWLAGRVPGLHLAAWVTERTFTGLDEPGGWRGVAVESDAHIAFDMVGCGIVEYMTALGIPELSPIFCAMDDVGVEYMTGLELHRTTTLARGGDRCDFRFVRSGRS